MQHPLGDLIRATLGALAAGILLVGCGQSKPVDAASTGPRTVDDLFTMIFGITSAWMTAPGRDCGPVDDTEHQRRASIIEGAVRRLCTP